MDTVDIDVDNLFNDGQLDDHLNGQLDSNLNDQIDQIISDENTLPIITPAIPGLPDHFLNLRYNGGTNRVSWSRQGHIAVISEDGTTVNVHCLRLSAKTKQWRLSVARPIDAVFDNAISLMWSPAGLDLAIVDSHGRISIYSMTMICLNRLNESKAASTDSLDDLGMPVGMWWLNQDRGDRPRNIVSSTTKVDDKWSPNMTKAKAWGPLYLRAFCMVNRQGVLNLVYQKPGARYFRVSITLPALRGIDCTHAAFSPTMEGKILLVVHTIDGGLAFYFVKVNWPQDLMTDPTSTAQPELMVEIIDSRVSICEDFELANSGLVQGYKPEDWVLTHLTIIPTSDIEMATREPPCIWATFTSVNPSLATNENGFLGSSMIRRYNILSTLRMLHPRFDDILTKTEASTLSENVAPVEQLPSLTFAPAITSIELIDGGQSVAISTADGKTELWNPVSQAPVSFEGQPDEITSLAQFGFTFEMAVNAVQTIVSPTVCSTLNLSQDSKPIVKYTQYHIQSDPQSLDLTDPTISASVAAIILAFFRSCWSNTNGDDLLACVQLNYTPYQSTTILSEMYRTLFRDTEFINDKTLGSEVERLVTKPIVLKVLSFQMSILNNPTISVTSTDESIRYASLAGVWAWVAVNLRYIATTFYIFYREYSNSIQPPQNPNQPPPQPLSPAFVEAVCHTIRWTLDLVRYMISTILEIGDRQTNSDFFTPPTFANNLGDSIGDGSQGLVALIINCQWSRSFLAAINRAIRVFIDAHERGHNPLIARIVQTIQRYSVGKGMKITVLDRLLDSKWYTRNGLREGEQMDASTIATRQIAMCSSGRVGPEYGNTLRNLLDELINKEETGLRATGEIERLKLWADKPDLNWLLLGYGQQFYAEKQAMNATVYDHGRMDGAGGSGGGGGGGNSSFKGKKMFDVHRKSLLVLNGSPDQLIRRCVRCGSVSGDLEGPDKTWSKNMVGLLAKCVCDAYWIMEPVGGEVEEK